LRIKTFSPEVARHHRFAKTSLIGFDPRSPLHHLPALHQTSGARLSRVENTARFSAWSTPRRRR